MPVIESIGRGFTKIFGSRNDRLLKRYRRFVEQINAREPEVREMTDEQLRARTQELRAGIAAGQIDPADVLPEVFAIMRESMDRHIGIRSIFNPEENFDPDRLGDEMLEAYDEVQRRMIASGESWQAVSIPHKLYDAVRALYPESRPPFRARCFDVQLIGGIVLYEGRIAEMATGEGKTFVAPLACFMRVLEGLHCHVVTVNDYLVRRDANWVRPAFENLGISVGYIQSDMEPGGETRRKQYECDVTYGTNSEFGFDYLRDNMKERVELQVQGPLHFAIVDEVDSILIDEARTPLIISGPAHDDAPKYRDADEVARKIIELHKPRAAADREVDAAKRALKAAEGDLEKARKGSDAAEAARKRISDAEARLEAAEQKKESLTAYYEVELDKKTAHLTHEGIAAAQDIAGVGSFFVGTNMEWPHLMEQAMRAHVVYEKDKEYVVERGQRGQMEVVIVDEYTGRKMVGRQWSDGLHQAIEAKERVPIKQESQTMATITLQNFFKLYKSLAGMTGTAQTEAEEFNKIYRLEVVTIPTNRPVIRVDHEDRVYRSEKEKWESILAEIKETSDEGRPVLVGTTSVEKSEMISNLLTRKYGIEHEVLNAKHHEREAQIIVKAGQQHQNQHGETVGNVTIATNMAGRGTDIKLTPDTTSAGGLHVIGTERHTARRIDNQLRGRGGRQGDPGSSRFYVSLQDDLMKMFAPDWTIKVLGWLGMEEGVAIEDKRITKGIIRAQKKVEERNFLSRKTLLDYDEVMDHQRTQFYGMRQRVLEGREIDDIIWDMIGQAIDDAVEKYIAQDYVAAVIAEWARMEFDVTIDPDDIKGMRRFEDLEEYIKKQAVSDAESNIPVSLGEFMGEDPDNPDEWDTKGLSSWAMSKFQVNLSQAHIRKMDSHELEEKLVEAAIEQINKRECSGIIKYLEPLYAETELANWANQKFGITIRPQEMIADHRAGAAKPPQEIVALIESRARESYTRREIEYPVDHVLTFATGGQPVPVENPYAADFVRQWARSKYGLEWAVDEVQSMSLKELRDALVEQQQRFLTGGELQKEVDRLIQLNRTPEALLTAANERFGLKLREKDLIVRHGAIQGEGERGEHPDGQADHIRDLLIRRARGFFRHELTMLEQFVLIQIFDTSWKDHLYAMDMLKTGIGLHAFAERDPRILYKKEGFRFFEQMMEVVRDKVTDLIFRARVVGEAQARSVYRPTTATHESSGGYGVGEHVRTTGAPEGKTAGPQQTSDQPAKVKTIVREAPKVGRNDPCPCGSGKKYKKCCGQYAA